MFSLKLTNFSWKENSLLYCFVSTIMIGFAVWGVKALTWMIPVYVLISCHGYRKNYNWMIFWGIVLLLLWAMRQEALFIIIPAYLIVVIVRLTSRSNQ